MDLPALVVWCSRDNAVYPPDARASHETATRADKTFAIIQGADHYGVPLPGVTRDTRAETLALLGGRPRARFPVACPAPAAAALGSGARGQIEDPPASTGGPRRTLGALRRDDDPRASKTRASPCVP